MVSVTNLCGTLITLCATLNNVPIEEVVAQISYDTVDSHEQIIEMVEEGADPYSPRNVIRPEVVEYVTGYLKHVEEQERIQREQEMERQRLVEEARQRELEAYPNKGYRQTYYSVAEGETNLGAGYNYRSSEIKVIDNIMNFYDNDFGYLPIYAININKVMASGLDKKGTPNIYGSVIEIKDENGNVGKGIILDACGACSRADKIDLWVYNNDIIHDVTNLDFKYIRNGWEDYVTD